MVETYRGTIYTWHCDQMGHMNVQHYAGKFDEATWQLFSMISITPNYLRENNRGMFAIEQKIRYKNELLPGDVIAIYSRVLEINKKSIRFEHILKNCNTNEVAAETELTGLHIDTVKRKTCKFPYEVHEATRKLFKSDMKMPSCG
jgi:acyl-CoA thioester hydrolase